MCYISFMKDSRGQNIVEYLLLVTAVLLVGLYFFASAQSPLPAALNATLDSVVNQIDNINSQIKL